MRILITGIAGLVGSYLAEHLINREPDAKIYGTIRWRSRTDNIEHLRSKLELIECDVKDPVSIRNLIKDSTPDVIFHMASQSSVFSSWHSPRETLLTNILGEVNLFEAARDLCPSCKILIPCSSEEYGLVNPEFLPVNENTDFHPLSPYAVSKVVQDLAAYQYSRSYGIPIYRIRAFNHTGPRREPVFVESDFAKRIAEIEAGKAEPVIFVGNLEARRDYSDVRDVVRAYRLAGEKCNPGEAYNVCSGKVISIGEMLHILLSLTDRKIEIKVDQSRIRPYDAPAIYGDASLFKKATGWEPEIPFEKTLADILEYWRERIR
jgi:GDP-4-dehydro-6-deoxy-D-mannose reductase